MKHFLSIALLNLAIITLALFPFGGLYAAPIEFENPVTSSNSLVKLIENVLEKIQPFLITLTALGILWVGLQLVIAVGTGNEQKIRQWKSVFAYALLGAAIVAGSVQIIKAIEIFAKKIGGSQ